MSLHQIQGAEKGFLDVWKNRSLGLVEFEEFCETDPQPGDVFSSAVQADLVLFVCHMPACQPFWINVMSQLNTPLAIFKLLDGSNCRECGEATCLAFAAAVFRGQRTLAKCPRLSPEILEQYGDQTGESRKTIEEDMDRAMEQIRQRVRTCDLAAAAERVGGRYHGHALSIKVLGKNFHVHDDGSLSADIHVNPWISIPVLDYIMNGRGAAPTGTWVPFRELSQGRSWQGLFAKRSEEPLKKIADTYTGLFEDMLEVFSGRRFAKHFDSDVSILLHPLPKVPLLICYWKPEDGMDSSLHLFFDQNVEDNLSLNSIFALGSGLVRMFERLAVKHEGRDRTYF